MYYLFLFVIFLIGFGLPFLFIKARSKIMKWIPAMLLVLGTIAVWVKFTFFPGEGMADLGELVYLMMLAVASLGAIIGGAMVQLVRKQ
jgi:hypothetical protein